MIAGVLGLVEDIRGVPVVVRGSVQLLIGIVTATSLCALFDQPWWTVPLGALMIAAYVNIANFMDGLNGVSGLHGFLAGAVYGWIGISVNLPWLSILGFVVAGAFAAFLPWNLSRPGLFLGDVGSYLLGAGLASLAVASMFAGIPVVTALSPLAIYLADTLFTLGRRAFRGEPILRPHRTHAYQRLTDTGLSHVQASLLVTAFSAATSIIGTLVLIVGLDPVLAATFVILVMFSYLFIPWLRGSRLPRRPLLSLPHVELPPATAARERFRPNRWVVLGASGFVGGALATHLETEGFDVVRGTAPRLLLSPSNAEVFPMDGFTHLGTELESLTQSFKGADVVINAAGLATPDSPANEHLYGANALLPALIARAASDAGVTRVIHLSSAAVQGRRPLLDETLNVMPFSPYSHSKALGELSFLASRKDGIDTEFIVIRATSVQGPGRHTTESFRRVAQSTLASVAAPGTQPTVVSSIQGLVDFIRRVAESTVALGPIMLQPWEGHSVHDVLRAAGGRPRILPRWFCLSILAGVRGVGRVVPEVAGAGRRLEMMWLGQTQVSAYSDAFPPLPSRVLESVLMADEREA